MEITVTQTIAPQDLADWFVGSIEGNHMTRAWVSDVLVLDEVAEKYRTEDDCPWYSNPAFWKSTFDITVIHDGKDSPREGAADYHTPITPFDVKDGLELMAANQPMHYADLLGENADAITYDVMLQYIVLKELVFG